jgi:hypothetical protein
MDDFDDEFGDFAALLTRVRIIVVRIRQRPVRLALGIHQCVTAAAVAAPGAAGIHDALLQPLQASVQPHDESPRLRARVFFRQAQDHERIDANDDLNRNGQIVLVHSDPGLDLGCAVVQNAALLVHAHEGQSRRLGLGSFQARQARS